MNPDSQFSRLDIAFSHFLAERSALEPPHKQAFEQLCARLSYQQSRGHSCLYIDAVEQELLQASGWLSPTHNAPLVLENNRLYLQRYWFYENRLATQLCSLRTRSYATEGLDSLLSRYFIELIDETDWQRAAVKKSVAQAFSMITGGPGTGKTTTVVKILAILQELSAQPLHIALAAPTGKAAMRLQESITANKSRLPCSEAIKNRIPDTVSTLHYLLGAQANSPFFKHNAKTPLAHDLVVIDEASMVDLALMSKLVDALKPGARLILLGDKDQLSAVESGAILADLTASLPAHTHELKKSYRFQGEIKALADAVNTQSVNAAWQLLAKGGQHTGLLHADVTQAMLAGYADYLQCIANNQAPLPTIFSAFNDFQVLCSNRQGKRGVLELNDKLEKQLLKQNKIQFSGQWYVGRPVMVMQNHPGLQLYNGDIGICLADPETNKWAVFFLRADGHVKKVLPSRMPEHETVFAMTIHKSQGSEFTECLCVLADKMNPVLNKKLLYTAITRAKEKLTLACDYAVFRQTVEQQEIRASGLFAKLQPPEFST
ncbi:MAG TPA: exodeoxyribonuclease V subunit alpha [Methylococcaceae bacterium]|nr:exodeoxyribonuclease V subunit alpha [Methylococcaceae bacterium]